MAEGNLTRKGFAGVQEGVNQLLDLQSANPPPRLDDLDVMVLVQQRFKVGRINHIMNQFGIDRPPGLTKEAKAQLLVNKMPRPELMKLLNEAELPPPAPEGKSETCDDKAAEAAEEKAEEPPATKRPRLQASDSPTRADLEKKSMRELREMLKALFIKTKSRGKRI